MNGVDWSFDGGISEQLEMHPGLEMTTKIWTVPGWDEELRCEAFHSYLNPVCSVEVTHLSAHCGMPQGKPVCANTADYAEEAILVGRCDGCARPCADCWSVRPI